MSQSLPMDEEGRWGQALEPEAIALTDAELREAACRVDPREAAEHPEKAWTRYLRAMALIALRRWISQRKADLTVGPELEPEDPQRLLALNGRAAQLLCCSPMDESVEVPVELWQQRETAPQLLLLAQVDEDNGLVHFPGALDGESVMAELSKQKNSDPVSVPIDLERIDGGLERLLRLTTLLEQKSSPRHALNSESTALHSKLSTRAKQWLSRILEGVIQPSLTPVTIASRSNGDITSIRLLAPQLLNYANGIGQAVAVCQTPSLWADHPLADIQMWKLEQLVWRRQATSTNPIEGPIAWPLNPLYEGEEVEIRLRPWGAPIGSEIKIVLGAPSLSKMNDNEDCIQELLQIFAVDRIELDERLSSLMIEAIARSVPEGE